MNALTRRQFATATAAAMTGALAARPVLHAAETAAAAPRLRLGIDNFAVRALKYNANQLIDYAAAQHCDSLFITDFGPFAKLDDAAYLKDLARRAADVGVAIQLGSWSICPSSARFKKDWGTADEHLALGIRMAKALNSPVFRVVLGSKDDRRTKGGIAARIDDTVAVLKRHRSAALDAGVKVAVENHAGDLHSTELVQLIEAAGKDYVGANIDMGNACWTLEDPLDNLETLAPYVLTSSLRDSAIWEYEENGQPVGAKIQWAAMGEGYIDLKTYFQRWRALCPQAPVHIETISGFSMPFPYYRKDFWPGYEAIPASSFARFIALARRGKPFQAVKNPTGRNREESEQLGQKAELERSLKYCRDVLGLGMRPA